MTTHRRGPGVERPTADGAGVVGLFESAWRHRAVLVIVVLLAGGCAYFVSSSAPSTYQAETTLLFSDATNSPVDQPALPGQDRGRYLATQASVVTSEPATTAAANVLRDGTSAQEVAGALTAAPGEAGDTLTITATAHTGRRAAQLADAGATGYLMVLRYQGRQSAAEAVTRLQHEYDDAQRLIDRLSTQPRTAGNVATIAAMQDRLRHIAGEQARLRLAAQDYEPAVRMLHAASVPGAPISPAPLRDAGLAAVIALLVCGAAAWAFEAQAQRRSDLSRFNQLLGTVCLGRISTGDKRVLDPSNGASALAGQWQQVVSAMDASLRDLGGHCLLMTSPAGAGYTSRSAACLALSAAADGRFVIVVDADLGRRELSMLAGAATTGGLTELVSGGGDLRRSEGHDEHRESSVALLPAGAPVSNSAAFYRRTAFRTALASIGQRADLVLVVGPPVLDQPDAAVLADAVDGVLLVVPESTTDTQLRETRARLSWSRGGLVGYVVLEQPGPAPWRHPFPVARNDDDRELRRESKHSPLRGVLEPLRVVSRNGSPSGDGVYGTGVLRPPASEVLWKERSPR